MITGVYAVLNAEGGPLPLEDCAQLGLTREQDEDASPTEPCRILGVDRELGGLAVSQVHVDGVSLALVGEVSNRADVARRFGRPADSPPAVLADSVWRRHGADLALHLEGEWSLARWSPEERVLTVSVSQACRDPVFYAENGGKVAVAPRIAPLSRLAWVEDAIDPEGLAFHFARARLRRALASQTPVVGIRRIPPGGTEVFGVARRSLTAAAPAPPPRWTESFEAALARIDEILGRALVRELEGHRTVGGMLSGGLDSSLLAWFANRARREGQTLAFYSSTAPTQSGLPDDWERSKLVAERLGATLTPVCPAPDASVYIPSRRTFDLREAPLASPRHYLYDAFYDQLVRDGATLVFDGAYGEAAVSARVASRSSASPFRRAAGAVRRALRPGPRTHAFNDLFHVRLSMEATERLASMGIGEVLPPPYPRRRPGPGEVWGFPSALRKSAMTPTSSPVSTLRHVYPLRDTELLTFVSAIPAAFMRHAGLDRSIARHLLLPHLPTEIALARKGGAFSPDYERRCVLQTGHVLDALPDWRASEAAQWLDLDWLEHVMTEIRQDRGAPIDLLFQAQATAIAAAYFPWRRQMRGG